MVPVRNMILPGDSTFYTLFYPEHYSQSYLCLYRFSISDGSYQVYGDSIPMRSDKIATNANLYYNANRNELYAVTLEFDNQDQASVSNIYSLSFPPITKEQMEVDDTSSLFFWIMLVGVIVIVALLAVVSIYIFIKRKIRLIMRNRSCRREKGKLWITCIIVLIRFIYLETFQSGTGIIGKLITCSVLN